jgi:predicted kinase
MNEARLYILCGLPFAGKTTLAQAMARRLGFTSITLDDINSERGVGLTGEAISQADWARSYAEAHRRLDAALAAGQSVIYDATNFQRKERDRLRDIATRHGLPATVVYLNLPAAEVRRRWLDNRASGVRYDVRDEDFAQVADNFEPPADEDVIIYDGTQPVAEWVSNTFGDT